MNAKRLLLVNVIIILVIIVAGFAGYYFYNQSTLYLKTDNAQVTGQEITIAAPAAGKLTNWDGTVGTQFNTGETAGDIQVAKGQTVHVSVPASGTIVANQAVDNEYVAPGTLLAYAFDLQNLWVTANIKETDISDVKVGQDVDIYVDAFPGITLKGTVSQIGKATASTFSLMPSSENTANYTKVTQVIPVKITLQQDQGIGLVPGMNATVRIHK
jgi:multidrug resistance efflux pump